MVVGQESSRKEDDKLDKTATKVEWNIGIILIVYK